MATYTGVADANGDFIVPFSSAYTSGEKITVTAEKDGAEKSIELFAPSEITGGGVIQFSGNLVEFPNNIGGVIISGINGSIGRYAFASNQNSGSIWNKATSLELSDGITAIGSFAFGEWSSILSLKLPSSVQHIYSEAFTSCTQLKNIVFNEGLKYIENNAFSSCVNLLEIVLPDSVKTIAEASFFNCKKVTKVRIGSETTTINGNAFALMEICTEIKCHAVTPPTITSSTFTNLNPACIFKVPAASVAAYQAAANWSAFAERIQAI